MRKWHVWIGLAVSLILIIWAFSGIDGDRVWAAMQRVNYFYFAPALAVYLVGVWFRAMRWRLLLAPMKPVSAARLFPVLVVGYMANNVLPARMGELVRAYLLGEKEKIDKSATLATIFIERLFDGVTLVVLAAVVSFVVPFAEGLLLAVRISALLFGLASLLFLAVAFAPVTANRFINVCLRALPNTIRPKVRRLATSFVDGLQSLQQGRVVAKVLVLSLVAWVCEGTVYYIVGLAGNIFQPYDLFVLVMAVANIGIMLPSSPGFVGPYEAAVRLVMASFQIDPNLTAGYIVVLRVVLFVPVTLLGFFLAWRQGISLSTLSKAPAASESSFQGERLA